MVLPNGRTLFTLRDFEVPGGSQVLIEGASGTGKTTLLHLIAGLMTADEGAISAGDFEYRRKSENELCHFRRENIGLVFQRLNLIEHLTVAENVGLSMRANHEAGAVSSSLERVGMSGRDHELCSYLSQGEQQRVAVARVLAAQPRLILADEPTSSLDEKNALFVAKALQEAARGKTLIVVSHDERIRPLFTRVVQFEELVK